MAQLAASSVNTANAAGSGAGATRDKLTEPVNHRREGFGEVAGEGVEVGHRVAGPPAEPTGATPRTARQRSRSLGEFNSTSTAWPSSWATTRASDVAESPSRT